MLNLSRSVYRYQPDMDRDLPVITAIQAVLEINPGYGFGKLFKTLHRQGYRWNHKRVYEDWMVRYNNERPHDSLNDMTPVEFMQANNQPGNSNPAWN